MYGRGIAGGNLCDRGEVDLDSIFHQSSRSIALVSHNLPCHLYRHRGHYLVCNGTVFVLADLQVVWYPKDLLREDFHNVRYKRFRDPIGGADCGSGVRNRVFTIIKFDASVDERRDIKIYRDWIFLPGSLPSSRRAVG